MDTNLTENIKTLCRTCSQQIINFSQCHSLKNQESNDDSITLQYKLSQCIPEVDLDAVPGTTICNNCFIAVNFIYDFKNKCLQTEKKIKTYLGGMFSSAVFVEFMLDEQVQQTPSEIVHSGLLNENSQPINIKIENKTNITEGTSLQSQNMPNNELTDPQIQQMQAVNNIKTEDYEREVTLSESPQQTDLQMQSNDMTDVQILEGSVEIIDVDSSDNEHEIVDGPKFERTNNAYTISTLSEPSTSHMLNYTITNQNNLDQPNIEINRGLVCYRSNVLRHQCNICHRLFVSKRSLTSHRRFCKVNQCLNGDSLFKCSKCYFTCKYKSILTYHENLPHINGVAIDDRSPYKCHLCTKEFSFPPNSKNHMQCRAPKIFQKLKKCNKCNYSCYFNKQLKQHKLSHLHKCPHCNSTMPKSSLNAHIRRNHNNLNQFIAV